MTDPSSVLILAFEGDLDHDSRDGFAKEFNRALESEARVVVMDLSRVTYINSIFLSVLMLLQRALSARDAQIRLVATNPTVLRVFKVTSFEVTLPIFESVAAAVAA